MDHLCFFGLVLVMPLCASFYLCLVFTCWERADILALSPESKFQEVSKFWFTLNDLGQKF